MRINLGKVDYYTYIKALNQANQNRLKKLELYQSGSRNELVRFSDIITSIYPLFVFESQIDIWLVDFPYCVVNEQSRDHIISRKILVQKKKICKNCKYYNHCSGFPTGYFEKYGEKEVAPIKDLPTEVMIEVTAKCNYNCSFCYNHNTFSKKNRNIKNISNTKIKKIIRRVAENNIKIIRFTGGEPLLRKDIFELMKYAKDQNLEVRLNTNGSLVSEDTIVKFKGIVDNVLLPIESYSTYIEEKLIGQKYSLEKKVKAIGKLKKINIPVVRVGTVATKENISNFNKLADFILVLPIDEWELYRPISNNYGSHLIDNRDIEKAVSSIIKIRKKTKNKISIANAIPFCAVKNPSQLNSISSGALYDDGHSRLVIDPRGFIKPHYFIEKNIGGPLEIISAWNHPFMKKMRNLEYLTEDCRDCRFKFKCRGGSRYEAKNSSGSYSGPDPLMNIKNKIRF